MQLHQVGLVDLLESDPRPTFVVALRASTSTSTPNLTSTSSKTSEPSSPPIVYANPSLTAYPQLLDLLASSREENHECFWKWIVSPSPAPDEASASDGRDGLGGCSFWYLNLLWTKSVVRSSWVVVGANEEPPSSERPHKMLQQTTIPTRQVDASPPALLPEQPDRLPLAPLAESKPDRELSAALTAYLDQDQLTFLNVIHSQDWAATPLGPLAEWPSRLRQIFYQIITDSHPTAIYWGESRIVIYNHAFSTLCGAQHPHILGKPAPSAWPDVDTVPQSPVALFGRRNEWMTVQDEAIIFVTDNDGAPRETHINSSITPIFDAGECSGFLHSVQDVTGSRLWERRMSMLCNLSDTLLSAHDVKSYWRKVMECLEEHSSALDIPLAILYSVDSYTALASDDGEATNVPSKPSLVCVLEGSLGVPTSHALIPETLDLEQDDQGLASKFREAFLSRDLLVLRASDGTLPTELFEGVALRGFGDRCETAVVCPIRPTKRNDPFGLLLLGLNPRRPYDNDYTRYVSLLNQKLSAYLASSMLLESLERVDAESHPKVNGNAAPGTIFVEMSTEETNARIPAAETADADADQNQILIETPKDASMESLDAESPEPDFLVDALMASSTPEQLSEDDTMVKIHEFEKLQRMTELATVGICETDLSGRLVEANKVFFDLCGIPKVDDLPAVSIRPWEVCVPEEQKEALVEILARLVKDGMPQTTEIQLNRPWSAQDSSGKEITAPRWLLATFMPINSSDGTIHAIHGCFSDVSAQKWQLESERQRKEEALESKRQQENFMDMTSHEMRNPLGAIIHCADAIVASLTQVHNLGNTSDVLETPTGPISQASESSRIIDESIDNAETIIACAQHQKRIIDDLLTVSKLDSQFISITPCTVDPLVMVRNSLKMFEVEARRVDVDLTMTVDESFADLGSDYFDFDPSRTKQVLINLLTNALKFTKNRPVRKVSVLVKASRDRPTDETSSVRFMPRSYDEPTLAGRTDPVYLIFEVKDTGRGLSEDEMRRLFNKFQQASSFTHVNHGGSGLGLFISRRLTELQNGAIGVSSAPKRGSTFAFFIEAYVPRPVSVSVEETTLSTSASTVAASPTTTGVGTTLETSPEQVQPPQEVSPRMVPQAPSPDLGQVVGESTKLDGILVVEDNSINQQTTKRGLTQKGFKVDVANHGLEALEKLQKSRQPVESIEDNNASESGPTEPIPFNLVLMDIEMPVQDGLACARKIRELEGEGMVFCANGGPIPIIAVSAHAKEAQVGAALAAGCDDVLVKPYRIPELIQKMETLAQQRHSHNHHLPTPDAEEPEQH